jgi:hypothetical protein
MTSTNEEIPFIVVTFFYERVITGTFVNYLTEIYLLCPQTYRNRLRSVSKRILSPKDKYTAKLRKCWDFLLAGCFFIER